MTDKFGKSVGIGNTIILLALVTRAPSSDTIIATLQGGSTPRDALRLCPQEVMLLDSDVFVQVPPPADDLAPNLKPHEQRVLAEKATLDDKISKLGDFIDSDAFDGLDTAEQKRLQRQLTAMEHYSDVLEERIEAFQAAPPPGESATGTAQLQEKPPGQAFDESQHFQKGETDGFDGYREPEPTSAAYKEGHAVGVASRKQKDAAEAELNAERTKRKDSFSAPASKDTPPADFIPLGGTPAPVVEGQHTPALHAESTTPPPANPEIAGIQQTAEVQKANAELPKDAKLASEEQK